MSEFVRTSGPLSGLKVVEFGRRIAAPLAGLLLSDQGAEVVRVVDARRPAGPARAGDPVLDAMLARGKTEVRLDLSDPETQRRLWRLLTRADVILDNQPIRESRAIAQALRLDEARAANPGLIRCRIPAFPDADPRADLPEYEGVAAAAGGVYERPLGPPRYHVFPLGSVLAGLFAGSAVVAALIARLRDARGQDLEVSLLRSNYFAQILQVLMKTGIPRGFLSLRMIGTPFMRAWECRDGRYIYLHITLPAHARRILDLLQAAGYEEQVRALRAVTSEETLRDPSQVRSIAEAKRIRREYERIFRMRTADEWEALLGRELCCIKVRTAEEWMRDSIAAGMPDACTVQDPEFSDLLAPGPGVTVEGVPFEARARRIGEDALLEDVLSAWEGGPGPTVPAGQDFSGHPPLEGVRVADLTRVIAGPCAGRVLAELGADVVSIQNPTSLDWALSFHLMFDAGKRSVTLPFATEDGQRQLWAILRDFKPDVLLQNYRNLDVARAMGVGPEAVRAEFPSIVYTHLNAYGNTGEWQERPGFEQVVQAVSGIQMTYGGGRRPKLLPTPVIDIGSGLLGAFAAVLGLYHQRTTRQGAFLATHLTRVSVLFQVKKIASLHRKRIAPAAEGSGEVEGLVRTLDAYAVLAGPRREVERFLTAEGLGPRPDEDGVLRVRGMWRRTTAAWQRRIPDGVVLWPVTRMKHILDQERRMGGDRPAVFKRDYPGCGFPLTFVRNPIRLDRTPLAEVAASPMRGWHTAEFLRRIGVEAPEGTGVIPYPPNRPLWIWLWNLIRWGYFAWRSGNL